MKSLYDTLGVARGADGGEIKKAYRKLVLEHHPDKGGDPDAFKEIQHAYEVLSDDGRRRHYDMTGQDGEGGGPPPGAGPGGGMPFPFPFDLGAMFGGMGGMPFGPRPGYKNKQQAKGPVKMHEMPISLWDYYHGKQVKIQFERQKFCESCKGEGAERYESCRGCGGSGATEQHVMMGPGMMGVMRGPCGHCQGQGRRVAAECKACSGKKFQPEEKVIQVSIEPGMAPGEILVFPKACSDYEDFKEAGDLHIVLQEADEDLRFRRMNGREDLIAETTIGLEQALLGCSERMEGHPGHPEGLVITIPVGVQNGEQIKVAGEGMPKKGGGRGDLYVVVHIKASDAEKEVLRANSAALAGMFRPAAA